MIGLHEAHLLAHIAKWRLGWDRYDPDELPDGLGPLFVSSRRAAELIPDGAVCVSAGLAGHHRPSLIYWAMRDRFRATGHPAGLTWCAVGGQGGPSKIPGTLEELGVEGLVTTLITGHLESLHSFLKLADRGVLEAHTLPQGQFGFLIEAQADGHTSRTSTSGVGTFLDPRVGPGSPVTPHATRQLIEVAEDGEALRYSLPPLEVAVFNAPYADRAGNIYVHDAACLTEIRDGARAVHANGGLVLACVAEIIDPTPEHEIYVPADWMSAIVVSDRVEQTITVPQRHFWPMFTTGRRVDEKRALADVKFINDTLKITARRTPIEGATARLAASIMVRHLRPGALVNIGVGLAEEAARYTYEAGLNDDLRQSTETGCYGGVPTSGVFFGSAVNAERHETSAWVFHRYEEGLDLACLGILEVDGEGNVNVSRRGPTPADYVGPGGFTDIAHFGRTLCFCGSFAAHARSHLVDGEVVIDEPGEGKFVERVSEVTFAGQRALAAGKTVWYVTDRRRLPAHARRPGAGDGLPRHRHRAGHPGPRRGPDRAAGGRGRRRTARPRPDRHRRGIPAGLGPGCGRDGGGGALMAPMEIAGIPVPGRHETLQAARDRGLKTLAALPYHLPRALLRAHGFHALEVWPPPGASAARGGEHFQAYACPIVRQGTAFLLDEAFAQVDAVLVPHGCDALQGMGSVLADFVGPRPPVLTLYPPRSRRRVDRDHLAAELAELGRRLAEISGVDPDPAAWAQAAELEDRADDALAGLYRRRAGLALTDADFYRAVRAREYLLPEDFVALAEALPAGDPVVPAPAVPLVLSGIVTEPWLLETLADAGPGSSRTTWAAAPAGCCRPRPSPTRTRRGRTGSCAGPLTRPAPIPSPTGWTASGTWSRCPGPAGC